MHRRNRIIFLTLIILASVFLTTSFLTEFLLTREKIYSEHTYSDSSVIPPNSNTSLNFEVTKNSSNLRIALNASSTLLVSVLQGEKLRWTYEASELKINLISALDPDNWTVHFQNNNETSCTYSYTVTLGEFHDQWVKSYTWLRIPFFISAIIIFSLIPSIYYFDKIKPYYFDRIKPNLNLKSLKFVGICIMLVCFFFFNQIAGVILSTSRPLVITTGISMLPTMQAGDLVIVKGVAPENLEVGDIIIFEQIAISNGSSSDGWKIGVLPTAIMHRIIDVLRIGNYTFFQTQGDNMLEKDEYLVPESGVLGKAVLIAHKVGIVIFILSRVEVKLFLISLVIFVLFFWPFIKPEKKRDKQKTKNKETTKSNGKP